MTGVRRITGRELEELGERGPTESLDASGVAAVRAILDAVRREGDAALRRYNRILDRWRGPIEVGAHALDRAASRVPPEVARSIRFAARRIDRFHRAQRPQGVRTRLPGGSRLALEFRPLAHVAVYAPGGRAPYPSTVLMTALAARAAGVRAIDLATPARPDEPDGIDPTIAYAARISGVRRVFRLGGAVAAAAFAYGTRTVTRADLLAGPGNAYLDAAKRELYGRIGTDLPAGPSESLLVFDRSLPLAAAVREALAQLEHGPESRSFVVAVGPGLARRFSEALGKLAEAPPPQTSVPPIGDRLRLYGTSDSRLAWRLADALAPESLCVSLVGDALWRRSPPRCGALFLGPYSSVAFGDYVSGTNHVLPVLGTARYSGGLSVYNFGRWVATQRITRRDAQELAPYGAAIAGAEGMRWHAEAQRARVGPVPPAGARR